MNLNIRAAALLAIPALLLLPSVRADGGHGGPASILGQLATTPHQTVGTVPGNGDENPYGVFFVPRNFHGGGPLRPGDVLVSNFNNGMNQQGTGTTIVRIDRKGNQSVFFQGSPGLGLTTALGVLKSGFVLVGNLPTTDGTSATIQQTSLLVLDRKGNMVANLSDNKLLDGPWDLAVADEGSKAHIFVSNVLSGTVTRLDVSTREDDEEDGSGSGFTVEHMTQIASGYLHRTDPAALVVGPTGLAFDRESGVLYVASTGDNAIFAIQNAIETQSDNGMGTMVYQDNTHLHGPLGLVLAPNGHLITSNGDAVNPGPSGSQNFLVEFTRDGQFVAQFQVDSGNSGGAFGLGITRIGEKIRFATVDDDTNQLLIWTLRGRESD